MSEEMAPSWRSLASAASRSIKGYIAQQRELKQGYPPSRGPPPPGADATKTKRQSWGQWAGQKLRRGSQSEYDTSGDRLSLFPGWATRRYREPLKGAEDDAPFDVDVFVSGYACKLSGVGFNTRAGRTFLRLAKSFAALPKLPPTGLSRSTEDLLAGAHLPPLPDEITEESEMRALGDRLHHLEFDARSVDSGRNLDTRSSSSHDSRTPSSSSAISSFASNGPSHTSEALRPPPFIPGTSTDLYRWHANLEARLHPFWSSVLSNRTVRVSLYAADPHIYDSDDCRTDESASSQNSVKPDRQPIVTREVMTAVDGSFQLKFSVPWEHMCVHPGALHIAFGGSGLEHDLYIVAELLAPPPPGLSTPTGPEPVPRHVRPSFTQVTVATSIPIPLSYSSIRVISDIDDTVKNSGVLSGARAVFHNVFVKDLRDSVIRGMGDWYMNMWKRGVRFHYVSNGPFELLPVVNEFLQISQLPPGSIRLRSYGGRSLFNGLLSAPAMRKRHSVVDVLNHFPDARFFLVGDSGEQDLELYAEMARERPNQILGIFIRDAGVRGEYATPPLEDPTGAEAYRTALTSEARTPGSALVQINDKPRRLMTPAAGRYLGSSRSMSDAMPGAPPAVPRRPTRSKSGADLLTLSSSTSSDDVQDYFSSAHYRSHSPITEEPHGSPNMTANSGSWPPRGFSRSPSGSQAEQRQTQWEPQTQPPTPMSDMEKKQLGLQMRLWRVRLEVDPRIPIRVFREPEECVEVEQILDRLQVRRQ